MVSWSPTCISTCTSHALHLGSTSVESPLAHLLIQILPEYIQFQEVFSAMKATQLPPHRLWDCAIDLLLGKTLPRARIYPLPLEETRALEYVCEALWQGLISRSTSSACAGFFFVKKRDVGLHPYIDYHGLNAVNSKIPAPTAAWFQLPLISYEMTPFFLNWTSEARTICCVFVTVTNGKLRSVIHQVIISTVLWLMASLTPQRFSRHL